MKTYNWEGVNPDGYFLDKLEPIPSALPSFQKLFQVSARSEERFSRNAETDLVCRLLLEKKKKKTNTTFLCRERTLVPSQPYRGGARLTSKFPRAREIREVCSKC